jgi:hypothetical protein
MVVEQFLSISKESSPDTAPMIPLPALPVKDEGHWLYLIGESAE